MRKQCTIFLIRDLFPGALGGHVIPKGIVTRLFNHHEQNDYQNFLSDDFKQSAMGGGLATFQSFWSLKKGTSTLISV